MHFRLPDEKDCGQRARLPVVSCAACGLLEPCSSSETCDDRFDRKALKAFLLQRGLYNKGLWKHLCRSTRTNGLKFGTMCWDSELFVLSRETAILQTLAKSHLQFDQPLKDWSQYYDFRGFDLDSPIAGLLHYPLSLYWIITNLWTKMYPASYEKVKQSGNLCVHLIGVETEADMFHAFVECGHLLAPLKLDLHLFGNEISREADGKCDSLHNVSFQLHSGFYHDCQLQQLPGPDVIISFNSGLSAYPSYMKTIQHIVEKSIPFFCTDYCMASVIHANKTLQNFKLGTVSDAIGNPFHSPFRIPAYELEHPCFSNAIAFSVKK